MKNTFRIIIVFVLITAVAVTVAMKSKKPLETSKTDAAKVSAALPEMIEFGSTTCIPCKEMAKVTDQLRKEYPDKLKITFIDTTKNSQAVNDYGIKIIPTQVFLDAKGDEIFRHTGFFSKEDIIKTFKKLGIDLEK